MHDSGTGGARAAAQEMLATMKAYSEHVESLVASGWDAAKYRDAAELFEAMRACAALLRKAQVDWIDVLITRFEVAQALWAPRGTQRDSQLLSGAYARHMAAMEKYHRVCTELFLSRDR